MGLSPGPVKPKTIKLVFTASLLHCVLMVIFHQYQQNKQLPLTSNHWTKTKNANRPGLGQTQKCGGFKRIQVTSAPNIVIWPLDKCHLVKSAPMYNYVSPSNEGRHIVLVWYVLLLLCEACPNHNFFVFPDRSILFGMWVHDHKVVCHIP